MKLPAGLWERIEARAEATPRALFAVDSAGRRLDFAGYRDAVLRAAAGLSELGVGPGSVVSWQLPTSFEALLLLGALARLRAIQNPILPIYRRREVGFVSRQCGARFFVSPGNFRGFDHTALGRELAAAQPGLRVLDVSGGLPEGDPASLPPADALRPREAQLPAFLRGRALRTPPGSDGRTTPAEQVRFVFYTSGTTADPKGVLHAEATLAAAARGLEERLALREDDRIAFVFPVTHIGGPAWVMAALGAGAALLVEPVFDPARTIPFLAEHGVTQGTAGTAFHQAYLAAQRERPGERLFPRARAFPGGGAPKPPRLHHDVKAELGGAGVVSGYGLTEFPIATMGSVDDPDEVLAASEGRPTPGVEIRIAGPRGEALPGGAEGEVRLRGPQCFLGYVDPSLHADAFDAEGFFRSGDLGRLGPGGHLEITGRLKDVIVRKGENISAKEVEDLLHEHPAVAEAAVVGLPDPERGERVCAVLVPREGAAAPGLGELARFLEGRGLMRQKLPEQIEVVDALPRNPTGKVLKHELRARFAGGAGPAAAGPRSS